MYEMDSLLLQEKDNYYLTISLSNWWKNILYYNKKIIHKNYKIYKMKTDYKLHVIVYMLMQYINNNNCTKLTMHKMLRVKVWKKYNYRTVQVCKCVCVYYFTNNKHYIMLH